MYCPVCKAEYRAEFSQCSDCHVALVPELSTEDSPYSYVVVWRGEDIVVHDQLCDELEGAGIEYADTPLEVLLRKSWDWDPFNLSLNPRFGFVVSVRTNNEARAQEILEKLLENEPVDSPLRMPAEGMGAPRPEGASAFPLHWDPKTATVEVWAGQSLERLQFLVSSLQETGIPERSVEDEQRTWHLSIRPQDESQAREIVREVLEAAIPERTLPYVEGAVWYDEPVRNYWLAWAPMAISFAIFLLGRSAGMPMDWFSGLIMSIGEIGFFWMAYQAARYEIRPWRFILIALVPLSFVWYYYERYARRRGYARFPVVVRERISTRPSA
jgi:hypothetical protein